MAQRQRRPFTEAALVIAAVLLAIDVARGGGTLPSLIWTVLVAVGVILVAFRLMGFWGRK